MNDWGKSALSLMRLYRKMLQWDEIVWTEQKDEWERIVADIESANSWEEWRQNGLVT